MASANPIAIMSQSSSGLLGSVLKAFGLRISATKSRVLHDGIWVIGGQVAAAAGTLIGVRLLTELVAPPIFGAVSLLMGITLLGTNLFCTPFLQAATRFFPEMAREGNVRQLRCLIGDFLRVTTLVLVGSVLVGGCIYSRVRSSSFIVFIPLAALIVVDVVRNLEVNLLSAARRQGACALWQGAEAWARPALAAGAVLTFGATVQSILAGYLGASILTLALFFSCVRRDGSDVLRQETALDSRLSKQIAHYAFPLVPLAIVGWISSLSDRYVIGGMLGLEQVGIYAASVGLISRPFIMIGTVLLNTLRPVYFEAVSGEKRAVAQKTLRIWLGCGSLFFALGILAIASLSRPIANWLLAEQYRSSAALMPYLAFGYSLICLSQVFSTVSLAYKRSWCVLISESSAAATSLFVGIPLTYWFGLKGAAGAVPIYGAVQLGTAWWLARRTRAAAETTSGSESRSIREAPAQCN